MLPGQSDATYEAYDGVELRFLNGCVVKCAPLTVAEAVRYLRLFGQVEVEPTAHAAFVAEFPVRIGITQERLVDLGLEVEGCTFGDLTYEGARQLVALQVAAAWADDVRMRSRAQGEFLTRFPLAVGLTGATPAEVFNVGRRFTEAMYRMIYGLAEDFCTHLISAPGVQVLVVTGTDEGSSSVTRSSLPQGSTT